MSGFDFEDVAVARPDIEGAAHAAVGAHGLGALDARFAHGRFDGGDGEDGAEAGFGLDGFYYFDHVVERLGRQAGEVSGMAEHAFFHEGIAGADGDAVAAGDAGGAGDLLAAVPEDAGMVGLPVDGEGFVDLHVLAGLDAAAAEDALVGIVTIEGVGVVLLVGLGKEGPRLVLHRELADGVVDGAVAVVVVADGAVEVVIVENAIEGFALGHVGAGAFGDDRHAGGHRGGARSHQLAVDLDHAGVAGFDGAHQGVVADLGKMPVGQGAVHHFDEQFAARGRDLAAVDHDRRIRETGRRGVQ